MFPIWLMALQAAQKIGQAQNNNINQFNAQQQPIVNGQQQRPMVQNPQMSSTSVSSIYNALTDDDEELKKKKNTIGM